MSNRHFIPITHSKIYRSVEPDLMYAVHDQVLIAQIKDQLPKFGTTFVKNQPKLVRETLQKFYDYIHLKFPTTTPFKCSAELRISLSYSKITNIREFKRPSNPFKDDDVFVDFLTKLESAKENYRSFYSITGRNSQFPISPTDQTLTCINNGIIPGNARPYKKVNPLRLIKSMAFDILHSLVPFTRKLQAEPPEELIEIVNKFNSAIIKVSEENKKYIKRLNKLLDTYRYINFDVRSRIRTTIRSLHVLPFDGKDDDSAISVNRQSTHYYLTLFNKQNEWQAKTNSLSWLMMQSAA